MIILEDGDKEMLPYVRVEIEPGRWFGQWWFEVSYWDELHRENGQRSPCWVHYYQKDGGAFSLWRCWKKASAALSEVWFERLEEMKKRTGVA